MPAAIDVLESARACLRAGDWRQAEGLCRRAVEIDPLSAAAWQALAAALQGQGRKGEALDALRKAVSLRPDDAELLAHLGVALAEAGQLEPAVAQLRRALQLRPDLAPAHNNLGIALAQMGRAEEGARSLAEAVRLKPDYPEAHFNLGNVRRDLGRKEEAIEHYRRAIALRPGYGAAYSNLGLALTELGKHAEAAVYLRHALHLDAKNKDAHNNLGLALAGQGYFGQAEECYHEALRLDPAFTEAHVNLGSAYKEQQRLDEALACYELALLYQPQSASAQYNRSLTLLQAGDYERGWPAYEWRWRRPSMPPRPFGQPRWDGSALDGKTILLWCEQGLGDAIQFVRYASLVKEKGGTVILECPRVLGELFTTCPGVDRVLAEGEALPEFHVQVPLLSLPAVFGTKPDSVPATMPYLKADPELVDPWRRRLGDGFRVGLVWQGNPRHPWDRWRSVPLGQLAPLAEVQGVRLLSLQHGAGAEQARSARLGFEVDGVAAGLPFPDLAAVMKGLDLVVSVDSAAAHLAGALGVPVWLLVAAVSDWRWMVGREDTPWYPTMRLFRQGRLGDWSEVVRRVAGMLRRVVA